MLKIRQVITAIFKGKGFLLVIFWSVFIPAAIITTAHFNGLNTTGSKYTLADIIEPLKNGIGEVRYVQYDKQANKNPLYSFAFKEMKAENDNLGIFKTGLFKVVKISGLELKFYKYSGISDIEEPAGKVEASANLKKHVKAIRNFISTQNSGYFDIDLSNAAQIRIRDFDYSDYLDGKNIFRVQSRRASVTDNTGRILLRGHVTINANENCLESNNVTWDVKNKLFKIDGGYVFRKGNSVVSGNNIKIYQDLNIISNQAQMNKTEVGKCCVKLQ